MLVNDINQGDAKGLWKKLNDIYGVVKTNDTIMSIMNQLNNIKILKNENMTEYLSRVALLINQLEQVSSKIDTGWSKKILYINRFIKSNRMGEYYRCIKCS